LNIIRHPDALYRLMSSPGGAEPARASDYVRAAEDAGFAPSVVPGRSADDVYVESLHTRGRNREDLRVLVFTLYRRR